VPVFIDASAFYAVLDRNDNNHGSAEAIWGRLLNSGAALLTNNYVLLETCALLQNRLGVAALRAFQQDVVPLLSVDWISAGRHRSAVEATLAAQRRRLSVVDCSSFQTMREQGVDVAFCFDDHFREQGLTMAQ
jgi:predicted nucleic acid-binding protein